MKHNEIALRSEFTVTESWFVISSENNQFAVINSKGNSFLKRIHFTKIKLSLNQLQYP